MLNSKHKLSIYRKLQEDVSAGLVLGMDILNEELGRIIEQKREEMKEMINSMNKEIIRLQLKDGKPGKTPTKSEILFLMRSIMPTVVHGKTPTKEEILDLIYPLIPKVKDGEKPSKEELISLMKPLHNEISDRLSGEVIKLKEELSKKMKDEFEIISKKFISSMRTSSRSKQVLGGGGDSVIAGSNVTITRVGGRKSIASAAGSSITFVDNEVAGGSGTTFTLANTPTAGSVKVYALGQKLVLTTDYSITSSTLTMVSPWSAGDIIVEYRY